MGGVYTANPGPELSGPDVPPGWGGPDVPGSGGPGGTSEDGQLGGIGYWPFPPATGGGPFPPGYDPDYSFNTTVPASTAYDEAISVSTQLRDQTDYTTGDPGGSSSITWSATVNGSLRRIRFDGVGSYASSVDSSYASSAGFWGAAPTLDVELTADDNGENLILALTSEVGGFSVVDSRTISIGVITAKAITNWVVGGGNYEITTEVLAAQISIEYPKIRFNRDVDHWPPDSDVVSEISDASDPSEISITAPPHPSLTVEIDYNILRSGEVYKVEARHAANTGQCTWTTVIQTYLEGDLISEKTVVTFLIDSGPSYINKVIATIDADTGEITLL